MDRNRSIAGSRAVFPPALARLSQECWPRKTADASSDGPLNTTSSKASEIQGLRPDTERADRARPRRCLVTTSTRANFHLGKSEVVGLLRRPGPGIRPRTRPGSDMWSSHRTLWGFEDRNWSFPTGEACVFWRLASRFGPGPDNARQGPLPRRERRDPIFLETMPEVDCAKNPASWGTHTAAGRMGPIMDGAPAIDPTIFRASVSNTVVCVNYKNSLRSGKPGIPNGVFAFPAFSGLGDVGRLSLALVAPPRRTPDYQSRLRGQMVHAESRRGSSNTGAARRFS